MKRYLIINADDFGLCYASNAAVEDLFNHGAITTTTLMTTCPWAEDGVRRALLNPRMVVGLHLTTTNEYEYYKWGPLDQSCRSLMDARGYLYQTAAESLAHATAEDMDKELRAQYRFMEERGLPPEHIDSHMGTVYGLAGPPYLAEAFRLCAQHGLHFRLPKMPETFMGDNPALSGLYEKVRQAAAWGGSLGIGMPNGLFTHDYDVSEADTYESFRAVYLRMLERLPEGVSELFMHPCMETDELKAINRHWQKRVWEYRVLLDDVFHKAIQAQGATLCTYRDAPFFA